MTVRWIEFLALYIVLPLAAAHFLNGKPFFLVLWLAAGLVAVVLWRDASFARKRFFGATAQREAVRRILLRFALVAALLTAGVAWLRPEALFAFPRRRPELWAMVMLFYPIVSVYPQGLVFRALFFHRYANLFPGPATRLIAAAAVFSLGHILFLNPWTIVLTFAGGLLFARTYERTGSLILSSAEHALYGCAMFTIGLGQLFYHGAVR